jgi:hypothetical protein
MLGLHRTAQANSLPSNSKAAERDQHSVAFERHRGGVATALLPMLTIPPRNPLFNAGNLTV